MQPQEKDARTAAVRAAIDTFPFAVPAWRRIKELLLLIGKAGTPEQRQPFYDELRGLFEMHATDMPLFVQQVLPADRFPDHWRRVHPDEIHGQPDDWWTKTLREIEATERWNPVRLIYPELLTNPMARLRALRVAEDILRITDAVVASPGGITAKVGTEPTSGQGTNFGSELRDDQQAAVTQYGAGAVAFVFGRGIDGATLAEITAQLRGLKESYVSRSLISALTLIKIIEYEERSRRYYTPAFAVAARKRAALGSGEPGAGGSDI